LFGEAKCNWTEQETRSYGHGENRRNSSRTVYYEGKEVYMDTRTYLFGGPGHSTEMQAGTYRYEFASQLPPLLPSSYEARHGHIRYFIEAKLDIPWAFDKEFIVGFTVVRNDDMNMLPELKMPTQSEMVKTFGCCFCRSDPLMITASLPFTGYSPGQTMNLCIDYNNRSDSQIDRTRVCIKRILCYHSLYPEMKTKVEVETVAEIFVEGVNAKSMKKIEVPMNIPQILATTNNRYSNVLQLTYELKVKAIRSGCCQTDVRLAIPITLGLIPLNFDQQYEQQQQPEYNNFVAAPPPQMMNMNPQMAYNRKLKGFKMINFHIQYF